ncbi:MAG: hypothetical protein LBC51_09845 [Treponema sp.]|nr:hypothetical protein [Treponema sp.]
MVYSNGGLVSDHFDPRRLGKSMTQTEQDVAGPYLEDLRKAIQRGRPYPFRRPVLSFP